MNLITRTLDFIKERKSKAESGMINCIPCPFPRFKTEFPGIEQGMYYLVSGGTKSAKTQFTSYFFLYNSILYSYHNKSIVKVKVFYYALEETPQDILLRFMAYLLYVLSKKTINISPTELKSTNSDCPLDDYVVRLLESEEYQNILNYFNECVEFKLGRNPTAVWKDLKAYADLNGDTYTKRVKYNENGLIQEGDAFDYYVPNNPNEYVMIIIDHASLIDTELGLDLRQSINKLSEYLVMLRNRYKYIPILIQQQNIQSQGLDAVKSNKIRPTPMGCADSTSPPKDASVMLGIINPFAFDLAEYQGYNIAQFRGNIRFVEVVLNRHGISNSLCPLFFNGKNNYFSELPLPNDVQQLQKIYAALEIIRKKSNKINFIHRIKNLIKNI